MTTQHTPGPWHVTPRPDLPAYPFPIFADNAKMELDNGITTLASVATAYTQEDAALIAAAPDLLAALETLVLDLAEAHAEEKDADHYGDSSCSYCANLEAARAAIAKAKGETA